MRLLLFTTLITFFALSAAAQSSAFVLVDVSGSGPNDMDIRRDAKQITEDLIQGKYNPSDYMPGWKWSSSASQQIQDYKAGKGKPMIDPSKDGYLMIMPFGEKNTYRNKQIAKISNLQRELSPFFDAHYPTIYDDNYTYIDLAEAMAASYATSNQIGITEYYLIEVTDNLQDTDSRGPNYTAFEQDVIDRYGTNSIKDVKSGTLRYQGANSSNFQITVGTVTISNSGNSPIKPISPGTQGVKKNLSLTNPIGGTRKNPKKMSGNSVTVMWKCLGCDSLLTFRAALTPVGNKSKEVRPQTQKTSGSSATFNLDASGVYKVSVSAKGLSSRPAYIEVSGDNLAGEGGGCGAFPILLFLILCGVGYFLYTKNQRKERIPADENNGYRPPSERKDPPATGGGGGGSNDLDTF